MFEIMIFLGYVKGTQHPLFKKLFSEKAYLMGKLLTIEGRLRSFGESSAP